MKNPLLVPVLLVLALVLPFSSPVQAADADFQLELKVADESVATQDAAFAEAMRRLLARLSGDETLWLQPAYADLIPSAWRYIERFNYRQSSGDARPLLRLWFKAPALRAALQQRGFVLSSAPTDTLLWLLEQQGGESWLVAPDEPGSFYQPLPEVAQRTGVSLLIPLVDLQERAGFIGNQGEAQANASLVSLSQRYAAGAVLIGRIAPAGGIWQLDWTRIQQGHQERWSDQGGRIGELVIQGLGRLATAPQQARVEVAVASLELAVSGLSSSRVGGLINDLEGLSMVRSVRKPSIETPWQVFRLEFIGDQEALIQALGFGGRLKQTAPPAPKKPKKSQVYDPLADLNLPGRSPSRKKPAPSSQPKRVYFTYL